MIAPYHERQRNDLALPRLNLDPARAIRADDHFASPQKMQLVERERRGQTIDDALARAARLERQHEPRLIGRSARSKRAQAKAAVQSMCDARTRFGDGKER